MTNIRQRTGVLGITLGLLLILSINITGCGFLTGTNISEISQDTGITFPPHARLLKGSASGFQDTFIQAKVEIDSSETDRFIKTLVTSDEGYKKYIVNTSSTDKLGITAKEMTYAPSWWKTDRAKEFTAIRIMRHSGGDNKDEILIFVDKDTPGKSIVYLDYASEG